MKIYALACFFLLIVIGCSNDDNKSQRDKVSTTEVLFKQLPQSKTNINFSNGIVPDLSSNANLFDFDYFYNGSGVGIADINNDGLQDIFFCANQSSNSLFLNKGNLVFEDISATAGIIDNQWSTGVTFCDINQDGWIDIYVCQGGPYDQARRGNLLYLNQRDLTFKEVSKEYGLHDQSISTQAVFADFDNDGDEDCFVMNEAEVYGFDIKTFFKLISQNSTTQWRNSSHYYENVNGKFIDKTVEAGLLVPSFGLGLVVSDLNHDNFLDIYQANDYYLPDAMYINNGKGQFVNKISEKTKQIPFFGMGMDIADLNNDGLEDIVVLDMASADHYRAKTLMASMDTEAFDFLVKDLSFPYQYMFNSLQLKNNSGKYDNISHLAGIAKTDWSWTALIQDFDQNGTADIYITNGYRKYAVDNDFKNLIAETKSKYNNQIPNQTKEALYNKMPEEKMSNIFYQAASDLSFENTALESGLAEPSFSNGAAYGDLDNDGDLDLVVNNIDEVAFVYENQTNKSGSNYLIIKPKDSNNTFAKVTAFYGTNKLYAEIKRVRGYMSSSQPIAHFGFPQNITQVDSIQIVWQDGTISKRGKTSLGQILELNQQSEEFKNYKNYTKSTLKEASFLAKRSLGDLSLFYNHKENSFNDFSKEILLPFKQSTLGPKFSSQTSVSLQTEYVFAPSPIGKESILFKRENNKFKRVATLDDKTSEAIHCVFFDLENDGDTDIYVVYGGNEFEVNHVLYEDRIYLNDGSDNFERSKNFKGQRQSGGKVQIIDFDNDGFDDLILGNRMQPQSYPIPSKSVLYKNDNGVLIDVTSSYFPDLHSFGIINDILVTDLDDDNQEDVVIVGDWTSIGIYKNNGGNFELISDASLGQTRGLWQSITKTDINADGLPDLVLGNLGLNSKYTATKEKPLRVYAHDFDDSGSIDLVLSNKYKENYVPLRGRECSSEQMPFIKKKFPNYNLYARATIEEVYENLEDAYSTEANELRSQLLINKGAMQFEPQSLPNAAQIAPILDAQAIDFNKDGLLDLITTGNIYNTEPETPRLDCSKANILISDGNKYTPSHIAIDISANAKSIEKIRIGETDYLLFGINNGPPQLYEILN